MTEAERLEVIVGAFARALIGAPAPRKAKQQRTKRTPQQMPLEHMVEPAPTIRELDKQFSSILKGIPDLDFEDEDIDAVDMTRASGPGMS